MAPTPWARLDASVWCHAVIFLSCILCQHADRLTHMYPATFPSTSTPLVVKEKKGCLLDITDRPMPRHTGTTNGGTAEPQYLAGLMVPSREYKLDESTLLAAHACCIHSIHFIFDGWWAFEICQQNDDVTWRHVSYPWDTALCSRVVTVG